jgi:hypothetical protein
MFTSNASLMNYPSFLLVIFSCCLYHIHFVTTKMDEHTSPQDGEDDPANERRMVIWMPFVTLERRTSDPEDDYFGNSSPTFLRELVAATVCMETDSANCTTRTGGKRNLLVAFDSKRKRPALDLVPKMYQGKDLDIAVIQGRGTALVSSIQTKDLLNLLCSLGLSGFSRDAHSWNDSAMMVANAFAVQAAANNSSVWWMDQIWISMMRPCPMAMDWTLGTS